MKIKLILLQVLFAIKEYFIYLIFINSERLFKNIIMNSEQIRKIFWKFIFIDERYFQKDSLPIFYFLKIWINYWISKHFEEVLQKPILVKAQNSNIKTMIDVSVWKNTRNLLQILISEASSVISLCPSELMLKISVINQISSRLSRICSDSLSI